MGKHYVTWNFKGQEGKKWSWGPSGKVSAFGPEGSIPLKIRRALGQLHVKSYLGAKRPPVGVVRMFGEGVPEQVSSSSSNRGPKLRGPSQNSPRVAPKQDVNINKTKLEKNSNYSIKK
ncbi:hypothetical protein AVEN_255292-1 [Araneus ventricosus]|uniref:Uncharacterized protein n=1 Tax=Araneus ventricosus TaxID=182803 RepID=A0A4Y2BAD8_ARAVE|nr:hypothetical protein AVEN_255292-1 [Araneus ventricosus]